MRVPIRYGRRSTTRGDSYTMVVSPALAANELGTAIAVPYHSCDHVEEAEELWAAEDNGNITPKGIISASFGCVALHGKPGSCPYGTNSAKLGRIVSEESGTTRHRYVCMGKTGTWSINFPAS